MPFTQAARADGKTNMETSSVGYAEKVQLWFTRVTSLTARIHFAEVA